MEYFMMEMFEYSKNKYTFVRIFGILASRACANARTMQRKVMLAENS